jgi:DNA-binding SARP family transcriptional activator
MAEPSPRRLEVHLLGGLRVVVDGTDVAPDAWAQRRARDLVKLLALAAKRRLHREQIIDALWPELEPAAGGANLRKAVHFARRALGSEDDVVADAGMVQLAPTADVMIDTEAFEHEAKAALRSADAALLLKAAERYAGPLLPEDPYEAWLEEPRANLQRRYVQLLRACGQWEKLIELNPLDEAAHRELIRQLLLKGDRAAALDRFAQLKIVLKKQLGIAPDAQSQALYREALAHLDTAAPTTDQRASLLLGSALVALHRGDLEQAERDATHARQLAAQSKLGRQLGESSAVLGMVAHQQGRWRELFLTEFSDTVARPPDMAPYVFDAHLCLTEVWVYGASGVADGAAFAQELFQIAEKHGSVHGRALASLVRGEAALLSGQLDIAQSDLTQAVALHQSVAAGSGAAMAMARLAEVALAGGDRRRALQLVEKALEQAHAAPMSSHLVVRVLGTQLEAAGSVREAMHALQSSEEALAGRDACGPCSMTFRVAAAMSCARAGDLEAASSYVSAARRVAGMWPGGPFEASEWEARAALRLAEGRAEQAVALLREAADVFERTGHVLAAARCRKSADESSRHAEF